MPLFKDLAFIYVERKNKYGQPYLEKLYKDHYVHLRTKGWSVSEIMDGMRTPLCKTANVETSASKSFK